MGDRQWPDPQGWEALTQAEAERDARARDLAECEQDKSYIWHRLVTRRRERDELQRALAVAERERDQAREALRQAIAEIERSPYEREPWGWGICYRIDKWRAALAGDDS